MVILNEEPAKFIIINITVLRQISNRLPQFTAVGSHIGGCDDFLPSLVFSLRHCVNQCVSRFYSTVVKGAD